MNHFSRYSICELSHAFGYELPFVNGSLGDDVKELQNNFRVIPNELVQHIFAFLTLTDLSKCANCISAF